MALSPHEVSALLLVLEKHFGEPCLPLSQFKEKLGEWVEIVEDHYACEEDVPHWVLHLNAANKKISDSMLLEDQCVVYAHEEP